MFQYWEHNIVAPTVSFVVYWRRGNNEIITTTSFATMILRRPHLGHDYIVAAVSLLSIIATAVQLLVDFIGQSHGILYKLQN